MPGLYIGSTAPYSGKNALCAGLGLALAGQGLRVGYFKPVGGQPARVGKAGEKDSWGDMDAMAVSAVLGQDLPAQTACPVPVTQDFLSKALAQDGREDHMARIKASFEAVSGDKDLVLAGGSGAFLHTGLYAGLDGPSVAAALGLPVLLADRLTNGMDYDSILAAKDRLGDRLAGCVLTAVPGHYREEVASVLTPFLARRKVKVFGAIPHDKKLGSVCVGDLAGRLGGKLISGADKADAVAESFLIGTMQVENFLTHFRKYQNAAVIMGGDRSDLQLVAIEGRCACLILTGNLYPNDIILSRAENVEVPILVVREDTYSVARRMESLLSRHKLRDPEGLRHAARLVAAHVDVAALRKSIRL